MLLDGLLQLNVWQMVAVTFLMTQLTIAAVTVFLHRAQAHRALTLHPLVSHFFRFWLWLSTAIGTRQWVAVHRRHHAACETEGDPHSPQVLGLRKVLFQGAELYRAAAEKPDLVEKYGKGTPDDWMERRVYTQLRLLGVAFMLLINIVLFGVAGLAIWAVQMMWIPVWAAGVVNGIGHFWGYRNYQSADASTNIVPWGLFIGGEELHNNHHAFPSSARLSSKWWELDIGWMYIRVLVFLRLAQVRRLAPRLTVLENKQIIDMDTVQAVVFARMHVLSRYVRKVLNPVSKQAFCVDGKKCKKGYRQARRWLAGQTEELDPGVRQRLEILMKDNEALRTVYQYRQRLQDIWEKTASSQEQLLQSLRDWVSQAEGSGVQVLQDFAHSVRAYSLPAVKA